MIPKESAKVIFGVLHDDWFSWTPEVVEAFNMAISALEKQETAKIVIVKSKCGVTLWHECSKCGEPIDAKDIFCRRCGRKLIPLSEPYTEDEHDKS